MKNILAFVFGGIFAIGLSFSGMANPEKVLGFLDVFGQWDASLAFVMMGAIAVAFVPFQKAARQAKPTTVFNEPIDLPQAIQIDRPLLIGSVLFGIGWGIAGMCPAPSLTLIGLGHYEAGYFIVAMAVGVWLHRQYSKR
ncbi:MULTISPECIES: YeeE/YedE family protein [Vitreoscilla]|uniref:YeeE/YedE family protein n=1 Tax=Vitreoscilla stercoraria TaxID=61 RepID=A0ABY4EDA4_VITST|nr:MULTISPECIES: YeeE/YedE family protein [Vitreoscilla]AUZ04104.2 metallo-beta-lactamase superfamily protein [Vitreoscilla sp. C1]UOO93199.1 YeeE/YedE family protein [Vitreoscilla stercoraria]